MTALTIFSPQTTVETVFNQIPTASHFFIQRKTHCVGCCLARFCTLEEVADIYRIDLQDLIRDLEHHYTH